jgi:hypothetical protein
MANSWTYTFENLPRYTGTGTEYTYYFVENSLDGYDVDITYTRDADGNYSFTAVNTEVIDVTVNKVWNDGGADHTGDTVTVSLYRQAGAAAREHVADQTLPVSGAWSYTFADLPRYDANGDEYAYTLEEAAVAGYAAGIAFTKDECGDYTFTVTNVKQISVTVTKVWNDGGLDHSGDTVTVLLYRKVGTGTATQIASQVLPVSGSWTYTFATLPPYETTGNEYEYTVQEDTVPDGYYAQITSARDGDGNYTFTITNTLLTDITVTKVWDDGGMDHSGDTVTVTLYRQLNTTKTLIASQTLPVGGLWTYTFADLPRYDASGNEYTYLIEEDAVTGYSTVITFERDAEGNWIYTVTNTLRVGLVIEKRDSANGATLPGAKFDLYRQAGSTETGAVPVPGSSVYGVLIGIDYTSGADGRITIDGLLPATYWLVETQAPSGYKLPPNALGFTLGADGTGSGLSDTTYMALPASGSGLSLIVKDEKSSVLPDTGGPGTLIGTWLGLALIAITCFMYIALRANKRGKEAGFFSR